MIFLIFLLIFLIFILILVCFKLIDDRRYLRFKLDVYEYLFDEVKNVIKK